MRIYSVKRNGLQQLNKVQQFCCQTEFQKPQIPLFSRKKTVFIQHTLMNEFRLGGVEHQCGHSKNVHIFTGKY